MENNNLGSKCSLNSLFVAFARQNLKRQPRIENVRQPRIENVSGWSIFESYTKACSNYNVLPKVATCEHATILFLCTALTST